MGGNPGGLAAILSKPVLRQWFATCEPPNPYRSRFSTELTGITCISVTTDEAGSVNEESAPPCGEATQALVNWGCGGTLSRAFCISGCSSPVHPPASDSGAPSFTRNAWGPGIPYRVPCWTPCGFGEGSYFQYREHKGAYLTSHQV